MDAAGGALGETAIAGPVFVAPGAGSGTAYNENINEAISAGDALSTHAMFGPALAEALGIADVLVTQAVMTAPLAEGTVLGDAPSAPGGTTSDHLSETTSMADSYAASALWTVVAQAAVGWSAASPSASSWAALPPATGPWLKH